MGQFACFSLAEQKRVPNPRFTDQAKTLTSRCKFTIEFLTCNYEVGGEAIVDHRKRIDNTAQRRLTLDALEVLVGRAGRYLTDCA